MKNQNIIINDKDNFSFTSYSTNNELIDNYDVLRPENEVLDVLKLYNNGTIENKKYILNNSEEIIVEIYVGGIVYTIRKNTIETNKIITNIQASLITKNTGEIYYVVDSYMENSVEQRPNDINYSVEGKQTPRSTILTKTLGEKIDINALTEKINSESKFKVITLSKMKQQMIDLQNKKNNSIKLSYKNLKKIIEQKYGIIEK